jgi:hypothetical protein
MSGQQAGPSGDVLRHIADRLQDVVVSLEEALAPYEQRRQDRAAQRLMVQREGAAPATVLLVGEL